MFIFQTARWTDVPIQLKKRSYAGPPAKSRWDTARRGTPAGGGGSSVPAAGRPDWPNKQGRPMMIMKDMWLWMMHLPIKTCLCRLIYSPITCRVNNASCPRWPTRPGPRGGAIAAAAAAPPPAPVLRGCRPAACLCLPACLLARLLNSVVHIVIIIASCLAARQ